MGDGSDLDAVARCLGAVAIEAGRHLAGVEDRADGEVRKADGSPATRADLDSERLILLRLREAFPEIPVVAEESRGERGGSELFFLVDPLDGTRDYLSGAGEYSVNIALVRGTRPVAAALAAPPLGRAWIAGRSEAWVAETDPAGTVGAWRPTRVRAAPLDGLVALVSRRHGDPETERCLAALPVARRRTASSAAKFGLIASGEADLYVRCGPTMEWDTAAGDHIVTCAGGAVAGPDGAPLAYGLPGRGFRNGPFVAAGDARLAAGLTLPSDGG